MIETLPLEKIKERVGQKLGTSDWFEIDQDRINQFADCTNDHQWIHVDKEKAVQGPFGDTIAHGYLIVSLFSFFATSYGVIPEGATMAINYGTNKIRFINSVRVGSKIRDHMELTKVEEKSGGRILLTTTHTIEIEGEEKPACVGEALGMFFTA